MKFGTEFTATVVRVCGHPEPFEYSYSNQRQRYQQQLSASRTLCATCRNSLTQLLAHSAAGAVSDPRSETRTGRLPRFECSPGQGKWATSIRNKAVKLLFPVMAALEADGADIARPALVAMRLLFSIGNPGFWIDNGEYICGPTWLIRETEVVRRSGDALCGDFHKGSAFAYWKKVNPKLCESARLSASRAKGADTKVA